MKPTGPSNQLLLRADEAAQALNIGRSKIYEMLASGELPSVKIGRSVRIPAAQLKQWVEDRVSQVDRVA